MSIFILSGYPLLCLEAPVEGLCLCVCVCVRVSDASVCVCLVRVCVCVCVCVWVSLQSFISLKNGSSGGLAMPPNSAGGSGNEHPVFHVCFAVCVCVVACVF